MKGVLRTPSPEGRRGRSSAAPGRRSVEVSTRWMVGFGVLPRAAVPVAGDIVMVRVFEQAAGGGGGCRGAGSGALRGMRVFTALGDDESGRRAEA